MSIITLTTDFGTGSPYVAAMKGVMLSINPAATLVDLTHAIPPQDVRHAAVVLDDVTGRFPPETIHTVVVDPGVGTERAILYARIGRQQYVAPDNGLLSKLGRRIAPERIIRLENPKYWLNPVSKTFHGRDIMAPVAAHLSLGVDPADLGPTCEALGQLEWPEPHQSADRIDGVVLEIDSFGNLITNITADMLGGRPTDQRACVVCSIYETYGIYGAYAQLPGGSFIALVDSSERLELAIVGSSAARRLGITVGTPVTVAWE
jgi:S-adenosylmethionine hydrolase